MCEAFTAVTREWGHDSTSAILVKTDQAAACRNMRIGFDARMLGKSGIGTYVAGLLEHLPDALFLSSFVVFVGKTRRADAEKLVSPRKNVEFREVPDQIYRIREQIDFLIAATTADLDLLHAPHYNQPVGYRRATVVTIHDLIPLVYPRLQPWGIKRSWNKMLIRDAASKARRIIAPSQHTAADLRKYLGVPAWKIAVIPEAADGVLQRPMSPADESEDVVLQRLGITRPFLLYLGQWKPYKNLVQLIKAFELVLEEMPELSLVIGGWPDQRFPEVRELARALNGKVKLIDWVPNERLRHLYRATSLFVLPSLYEGFGLPVLEAMAHGTPVVCSNTTSLAEVAGTAAELWEPTTGVRGLSDAISHAMEPARSSELSRLGGSRAACFSWRHAAKETASVYAAALQG